MGIKRVIVFTEDIYTGKAHLLKKSIAYDRHLFFRYLDFLEFSGVNLSMFGLDSKVEPQSVGQRDRAMTATKAPGGIDLNPTILSTEIKRNGRGVIIPAFRGAVPDLNGMEGFIPNIINVTPVTNLPLLLGLDTKSNENPQNPENENEKPMDVSFNLSALPAKEREEVDFALVR